MVQHDLSQPGAIALLMRQNSGASVVALNLVFKVERWVVHVYLKEAPLNIIQRFLKETYPLARKHLGGTRW